MAIDWSALGAMAQGIGAGISGMFGSIGWRKKMRRQNEYNQEVANLTNQLNLEQWNRENAYNDPSAVRKRMEDAGFNPAFALQSMSNNSASSPTMVAGNKMADTGNFGAALGNAVNTAANSIMTYGQKQRAYELEKKRIDTSLEIQQQQLELAKQLQGYKQLLMDAQMKNYISQIDERQGMFSAKLAKTIADTDYTLAQKKREETLLPKLVEAYSDKHKLSEQQQSRNRIELNYFDDFWKARLLEFQSKAKEAQADAEFRAWEREKGLDEIKLINEIINSELPYGNDFKTVMFNFGKREITKLKYRKYRN